MASARQTELDEALRLKLGGMTADKAIIAPSGATCTRQALNKRGKRRGYHEQAAKASRGKRPCVDEAPESPVNRPMSTM